MLSLRLVVKVEPCGKPVCLPENGKTLVHFKHRISGGVLETTACQLLLCCGNICSCTRAAQAVACLGHGHDSWELRELLP